MAPIQPTIMAPVFFLIKKNHALAKFFTSRIFYIPTQFYNFDRKHSFIWISGYNVNVNEILLFFYFCIFVVLLSITNTPSNCSAITITALHNIHCFILTFFVSCRLATIMKRKNSTDAWKGIYPTWKRESILH